MIKDKSSDDIQADSGQVHGVVMPAAEQINGFWRMLEQCWNIEPREYFEREAPRNGFVSPLAMAVHYMWKREVKPEKA